MPDTSYAARSAISGAAQGFAMTGGNPYGALAGLGVGFFAGILGDSPEEKQRKRKEELMMKIAEARVNAIAEARRTVYEGVGRLSRQTSGLIGNTRQAGARRAVAMGRSVDAEDIVAPEVANIARAGSQATGQYIEQGDETVRRIGLQYDQMALGAEQDWAARPIEPTLSDTLLSAGASVSETILDNELLEIQKARVGLGLTVAAPGFSKAGPAAPSFSKADPAGMSARERLRMSSYKPDDFFSTRKDILIPE